jgi:hypothetical protein
VALPPLSNAALTAMLNCLALSATALALSLAATLMLWAAPRAVRLAAFAACIALLALSPPWRPTDPSLLPVAEILCRCLALGVLALGGFAHRAPPALRRAASAAGAGPFQVLSHAVLAPLAWPLLGAWVLLLAASAAALAGPPQAAPPATWVAAAAVLGLLTLSGPLIGRSRSTGPAA